MAKIKITISREKTKSVNPQSTASSDINESKCNQDDVVDKISGLLNIKRRKSDEEKCIIENC